MSRLDIAVDSDNYIRVTGLINSADDTVPSITSVTAELLDSDGTTITGSDISLSAVDGQSDAYEGEFPDTVSLVVGDSISVKVVVTATDGRTRTRTVETVAKGD